MKKTIVIGLVFVIFERFISTTTEIVALADDAVGECTYVTIHAVVYFPCVPPTAAERHYFPLPLPRHTPPHSMTHHHTPRT